MDRRQIIAYLESQHGKNVDEVIEQLKNDEEESCRIEHERSNNEREWYKSLKGRYFLINFNGTAFVAVYVENTISGQMTKQPVYNIYRNRNEFKITKENRELNNLWYNNPYNKPYYGQGSTRVRELTKEEFEEYEKLYKTTETMFNETNLEC